MTILVFVSYYLPGYRSGGPARSIANLVAHLGQELHFVVVTSDRDAGDRVPYAGIAPGDRRRLGRADVIYLDAGQTRADRMAALVRDIEPDALYLNSFFARAFSINPVLLRRLGRIPSLPIVLAPRGEFSPGALQIKPRRKRAWLAVSRVLGLHRDLIWQASSPLEAADIRRCLGPIERDGRSRIVVAPIIASAEPPAAPGGHVHPLARRSKAPGHLRVVFLSRLSPKKNLLGALRILGTVRGSVEFNIYGPVGDERYWRMCRTAMDALPHNVRAAYRGPLPPEQVPAMLAAHDLFFLPTLGENYGHVIREALAAGTPVLVSDQTPWRDLTAVQAGWDLPLERPAAFRHVLETCIAMDSATFADWSQRAARYAWRHAADAGAIEASRRLFRTALGATDVLAMGETGTINAC
jgi:glycosyltransferase involved in cell wall biosynthesis